MTKRAEFAAAELARRGWMIDTSKQAVLCCPRCAVAGQARCGRDEREGSVRKAVRRGIQQRRYCDCRHHPRPHRLTLCQQERMMGTWNDIPPNGKTCTCCSRT